MELDPITREELFLARASGKEVSELVPVTRKEKFLAAIPEGSGTGVAQSLHTEYNPNNGALKVYLKENESL